MGDRLDRECRGAGQVIEDINGVKTERLFLPSGELESLESWAQRHQEALAMFETS